MFLLIRPKWQNLMCLLLMQQRMWLYLIYLLQHISLAVNLELDSIIHHKAFGPVVPTPLDAHLTGYTWTFVQKQNDKGKVVSYKTCLVGKGFTQMPGIHYDQTYSPIMDSITFRYLIFYAIFYKLKTRQLDVATTHLYGILNTCIYVRVPPELLAHQAPTSHLEGSLPSDHHYH